MTTSPRAPSTPGFAAVAALRSVASCAAVFRASAVRASVLCAAAFRAGVLCAAAFRAGVSRATVLSTTVLSTTIAVMALSPSAWAQASDADPALGPELDLGGESDDSATTLDIDDFSVPDDASFEPLWDPSAYPDLSFTSPGYTLDVAFGRQSNELGSHWFLGAFVALPLGRPPEAHSTLYPAVAPVPGALLELAQLSTPDRPVNVHPRPVAGGRNAPPGPSVRGAGLAPRLSDVTPRQRVKGRAVGESAPGRRADGPPDQADAEVSRPSDHRSGGSSSPVSAERSAAERSAAERSAAERSAAERSAAERSAAERSAAEHRNPNGDTLGDHDAAASFSPPSVSAASVSADRVPFSTTLLAELITRVRARSGSQEALQRLEGMSRRERQSGLLPELRLRGAYGIDQSLALETVGSFSGEATSRGGSDSVVEARLTFHLDRLLAPQGATSFERMRHAVIKTEQEQVDQALELLAAVVEGEALAAAPDLDEVDRIKAQSRASGARARLHVLTGGWFPLE